MLPSQLLIREEGMGQEVASERVGEEPWAEEEAHFLVGLDTRNVAWPEEREGAPEEGGEG